MAENNGISLYMEKGAWLLVSHGGYEANGVQCLGVTQLVTGAYGMPPGAGPAVAKPAQGYSGPIEVAMRKSMPVARHLWRFISSSPAAR